MWLQFFSQNAHFAIHLFAALVCLAVSWLYLDSWLVRRSMVGLMRWVGFALLGLSFLSQATLIEQSVLGLSVLGNFTTGLTLVARVLAYVCIILGQLMDPLQAVPDNKGLVFDDLDAPQAPESSDVQKPDEPENVDKSSEKQHPKNANAILPLITLSFKWTVVFGGLATAGLYWRRATTGLERHLKMVAGAFLLLGLADLIRMATLLRDTTNPILFSWVAAFGWVWWSEQLILFIGLLFLGKWVWSYLTERFFSQLFMIFMSATVAIFLIVSVVFTGLLLRNIRHDIVDNLKTAAHVLDFAIIAKQSETTAGVELLAGNRDVQNAIVGKDHDRLASITRDYMVAKKQSFLLITNADGQVLLRGQEPSRWGDSLSGDVLINRALLGSNKSSVVTSEGVGAPVVEVRSATAVRNDQGNIVGVVVSGVRLDEAFIDGVKNSTGLQSSVYGGNVIAATTLLAADGKTRNTGAVLDKPAIKDTVLDKGQDYSGDLSIQNRQLLGAILPLKDVDNVPVGMLMVAKPQSSVLRTAGQSVSLTFVLTAAMLILSIIPAFFITKNLTKQLEN